MLLTNPAQQTLRRLAFGKTANRRRDQHRHQRTVRRGMTVIDALGRLIAIDLPMADPQQRQLRRLMLGGNPVRYPEQIRQPVNRRHLRAGINQHAQFDDWPLCVHCQFSPFYCRCGQSSDRPPEPILHSTPNTHFEETVMAKQALIVVDIQNDYFPQGKWPLVGADAAADNAVRLLNAFRDAGDSVVHIRHEFTSDEAPFFTPGSEGAKLHPKVLNRADEPVVLKHFVNSFRETELQSILDEQGIKELVVVGSMSHMCVDGITRAANDLGYSVTVIHDACASRDLEFNGLTVPAAHVHAAFMSALGFAYASVVSTDEFLAANH